MKYAYPALSSRFSNFQEGVLFSSVLATLNFNGSLSIKRESSPDPKLPTKAPVKPPTMMPGTPPTAPILEPSYIPANPAPTEAPVDINFLAKSAAFSALES